MANREMEIDSFQPIKRIAKLLFSPTTIIVALSLVALMALKWAIPHFIPYAQSGFLVGAICVAMFTGSLLLGIHVAEEWHIFQIVTFFTIVISLGVVSGSDYKTSVEKYKPQYIFRTDSKITIVYGDMEYSSSEAKIYNTPDSNIRMCKQLAWDAWGDRNMDSWYTCNNNGEQTPEFKPIPKEAAR